MEIFGLFKKRAALDAENRELKEKLEIAMKALEDAYCKANSNTPKEEAGWEARNEFGRICDITGDAMHDIDWERFCEFTCAPKPRLK